MIRLSVALAATLAAPVHAWTFTPVPVCTLLHDGAEAAVRVTHDPRLDEPYAIAVTRKAGRWPADPGFAIRFEGPRGLTIGTMRHRVTGDTLTVTDRGFGNVLDGLEFNDRAVALSGGTAAMVDLEGAAGPVQAFRACAVAPVS
jgi:hypothetical protein